MKNSSRPTPLTASATHSPRRLRRCLRHLRHQSALSNILRTAFENINDGYEVVQQAVSSSTDLETEKLMQRVNMLNICGQIAPMLG